MPRPTTPVRRQLSEYRRKRDFSKTAEPSGAREGGAGVGPERAAASLRFVVQKHAASHLHFDFRLELDGVMKSWAVPKGPSLDPSVKRLAMEVEDHPVEYNTFEGVIPQGQYGGGTVMLWDRGTYEAADPAGRSNEEALREGYARGQLKFTMHGERLRGSFALVRTRRGDKPQWLLIKHRDEYARPDSDVVAEETTSIATGRTMEEIAAGKSKVWQSNRDGAGGTRDGKKSRTRKARPAETPRVPTRPQAGTRASSVASSLEPMYASIGTAVPEGDGWVFEPKYDGIRVLAYAAGKAVKLVTRNGKDKAAQFPELTEALRKLAAQTRRALVLDGEIVALVAGAPARFQALQDRMHVKDADAIAGHADETPSALIAFDMLADGDDVLLHEPWSARRRRLEQRLRNRTSERLRLSEIIPNDGGEMLERARERGWEGVIAKRMDARYEPGVRSKAWLKLKVEFRQEFVIGGYTEPRKTRQHIGALLLGYFDGDRFLYVGHTGGGFTREGLAEMHRRLGRLERKTSPFEETPKTNERAHWVRPEVVVEVKFSEWTADGKLRQPIYLGTRDDKDAREVGRERESVQREAGGPRSEVRGRRRVVRRREIGAARARSHRRPRTPEPRPRTSDLVAQIDRIERDAGDGTLALGRHTTLKVTSLGKVFFPREGYTKGDLMRYYARMAALILPAMADRPLVLKRFPNGIAGKSFYQQKAPEDAPPGVRVETITNEEGERQERVIGGDLATLLYTVQLGSVSVDPWHSRVPALDYADYAILDLDPGPRAPFRRVVEVALRVKEALDAVGLHGVPKTSGSTGIHVYVPLPPRTTNESALLVAQLIATRVASAHPREATVERSVNARPPAAVYVDYLQNIRAKTVAGVYCVRAKPGATVSTPLAWNELTDRLDPRDFTVETIPDRVARHGDVWWPAMKRRTSLRELLGDRGQGTADRRRERGRSRT